MGNDSNPGTLTAPFATVDRARQAADGLKQTSPGRTNPISVMLRGGTYFLSSPWTFTSADSGSATLNIVYENYPGETPVISAGIPVRNWANVGGNTWQTTLPTNITYFEQLWYNGQRRLRPRLGGGVGAYYRVAQVVYLPSNTDPNCPTFVSGKGYECYDRFQYNAADPISADWTNLSSPYPQGDIELILFEQFAVSKLRIKTVDQASHLIYLTGPADFPTSGMQAGFIPNHRYIIENVREGLTQPGQWFLDRSLTPWVLTYLANPGEDPNVDRVVVPQQPQVLIATGLQWVTFKGLTVEHDNWTVPLQGYPATREDVAITAAVACYDCQNVTFDSDIITQTTGDGLDFRTIDVRATTAHNIFQNGAIFDVGGHGIRIGLLPAPSDTDSNVPQFTTIQNNVIAGFGRIIPSAFGIAQGSGHDNTYDHNDIYDGYKSGINVCAWTCSPGNQSSHGSFNNVSSFNHIREIGQGITNDMACIYYNVSSATGNKILNNKCHDVTDASTMDSDGYGGQGYYLDVNTSNTLIANNLAYRVSSSAVAQTCGPQAPNTANTIRNNIFAYSRYAAKQEGCVPSAPGILQFNFTNNIVYFDKGKIQAGCADCFGGICTAVQNYANNLYCYTQGGNCALKSTFFTTASACTSKTFRSFSSWQALGEDVGSLVADPLFVNPSYPADNFALQTNSPASKIGFVPFDVSAAGRSNPVIPAPVVSATFLTSPLPPTSY